MLCSVTWEPAVIKHQIRAQAHRNHLKISTKLLCSIKTSRQVQHDNYSQEPINHVHLQLISIATQPIIFKKFLSDVLVCKFRIYPPLPPLPSCNPNYEILDRLSSSHAPSPVHGLWRTSQAPWEADHTGRNRCTALFPTAIQIRCELHS